MSEIATLIVLADSSVSPGMVFTVFLILALVVLVVSVWLFRTQLRFRRSVLTDRHVVKRCPSCNAVMEPGASYCPNCGRRVPQVTTVSE
jgi:hypothetical protein